MTDGTRSRFPQRQRGARPRTIALVGIDGSGKTTQAHLLAEELAATGLKAAYRRNAGGRHWFGRLATRLGRADGEDLLGRRLMLVVESALRWLAILRSLLRRRITGEIAVMDRYAVCQYASLRAHGAAPAAERRARLVYRLFPKPDVTVLLAVDPQVAHDRIEARGYDHETLEYLSGAQAAYRSLPEHADMIEVNANGTPAEVASAILTAVGMPVRHPPRPLTGLMLLAGGPVLTAAAGATTHLADSL
ncbi:MAG: dTMP kinase [Actinoplanes sp.]